MAVIEATDDLSEEIPSKFFGESIISHKDILEVALGQFENEEEGVNKLVFLLNLTTACINEVDNAFVVLLQMVNECYLLLIAE